MHLPKYYLTLVMLVVLMMSGCKKNDNPISTEQPSQYLYGQVLDSHGSPLEGCGIHYIYTMTTSSLAKTGTTSSTTQIQFTIPTRSKVTLKIFRWYTRDTIATLVDDTLDAGEHAVTFDASKVTNGIYIYQLKADTLIQEIRMCLMVDDISFLVNTTPLVTTSSSGSFKIPYGVFGFDLPFVGPGSVLDSVYVSHTIEIVVYKPGYSTATKTITIDEANGINEIFTLTKP